jgi:hypothetical protein
VQKFAVIYDLIFRGGYPRLYKKSINSTDFYAGGIASWASLECFITG